MAARMNTRMRTIDAVHVRAPVEQMFAHAATVERWPEWLAHYRYVRILERRPDRQVVEMSANRPFGVFDWPTWWASEMWIEPERHAVRYRHIGGVTRGMDVEWSLRAAHGGTDVTIVHEWDGPPWPLIRWPAANWVIGPVFVHGIASRTLAGLKAAAEQAHKEPNATP
jgi:ribosome-associated toxin RatA of RatAB toxin-antitoxin module